MKTKAIFLGLLVLILGNTAVFAQSNSTLKPGVYRGNGAAGELRVIIANEGQNKTASNALPKIIVVYDVDGSVHSRGRATIKGTRVSVDYGNQGFETWTIVDNETFTTDRYGDTWIWVRNYRQDEL